MVDEGDDDRAAEEVGGSGEGAAEDGGDEAENGGNGGDVEGEKAPGADRAMELSGGVCKYYVDRKEIKNILFYNFKFLYDIIFLN